MLDIWSELEIPQTSDAVVIRRAYARRLKTVHPEDDAEGFKRLRKAYESAVFLASIQLFDVEGGTPQLFTDGALPRFPTSPTDADTFRSHDNPSLLPNRAHELVQSILDQLSSSGDESAANATKALFDSEELENIEIRALVEDRLADALVQMKPLPGLFVERIATIWPSTELARENTRNPSINYLLERLEGWRSHLRLRQVAKMKPGKLNRSTLSDHPTPLQIRAAAMMTSPIRPRQFLWNRVIHPDLAKAVQDQLERLRLFSPDVIDQLDDQTVAWWSKRKANAHELVRTVVMLVLSTGSMVFFFRGILSELLGILAVMALLSVIVASERWMPRLLSGPQTIGWRVITAIARFIRRLSTWIVGIVFFAFVKVTVGSMDRQSITVFLGLLAAAVVVYLNIRRKPKK